MAELRGDRKIRRGGLGGRIGRWVAAVVIAGGPGAVRGEDHQLKRLEAAVRSGGATAALELANAGLPDSPAARFWRAQAHALAGQSAEADVLLAGLASQPGGEFWKEAVLSRGALWVVREDASRAIDALSAGLQASDEGLVNTVRLRMAEIHLGQGRAPEAEALLAAVPESAERALLLARAALMGGRMDEAARLAAPVAAKAPAGPLRATALLLRARIRAAAGETREADRTLLEWVRTEPESPFLPSIILALDEIGGTEVSEVNNLLAEWAVSPQAGLASAAKFASAAALTRRQRWSEARAQYTAFATAYPEHPLAGVARRHAVEAALNDGQADTARSLAAAWRQEAATGSARAHAAFFEGQAAWTAGDFPAAIDAFRDAAREAGDSEAAKAALLSAALCETEGSTTGGPSLEALAPWPAARRTVLLERGLYAAARQRSDAVEALESYLAQTPPEPSTVAALCALAEIDLAQDPPGIAAARQHVRAARHAPTDAAWNERLDWLELWIDESDGQISAAVEKAQAFLANWPASPRRPTVRLKRAEWLGRLGDWPAAIAEYETLAEEADEQPVVGARAIYLAGAAELNIPSPDSLDRAIGRWSDAAALDESIVFPARFQQALAKSRLGQIDEALQQLDALRVGPPALTAAQRTATLLTRGELLLHMRSDGTTRAGEAFEAFAEVVADEAAPPALRIQALCRKGDALRLLDRRDEALAAYEDAARPLLQPTDTAAPPDSPWPARAGLSAVALLESRQEWKAAADLAQRLSAVAGPQAMRAKEKAARLRLEHFIWEE